MTQRQFENQGLVPGAYVRLQGESAWGLGQIQSVVKNRATVNFEHRGKVVILLDQAVLDVVDPSAEENK